ncbi:hypothetical protein DFA_01931 [Cavenderia fasciculata]|uniref:Uncharacterized protein n=1 Tax=Cavenderia fasciculata TaxID=261658 RepID=F4PQT4_CACFS|nr:uncharacterized protein DFA_01931 [Cavenderia fasciculata]EGG22042.1 hypothetical protein DFA_01931 [Cavenderia fasciculata]|eukprot:XP_004359893.1 hypothetical protein DFA_01931 [Cavenderia fasciculata]
MKLLLLFVLLSIILLVVSAKKIQAPTPTSWVTVEAFNEAKCPETSSIGGLVIGSNSCYRQQVLSCSTDLSTVTVSMFNTIDCSGNPANSTTFPSGQCGATAIWGFTKTYTCSVSRPMQPERSLIISVFDGCQSSPQPSQLTQYRWIPTYKCMTLQRCGFYCPPLTPYTGTGTSASASSAGSNSGSDSSDSSSNNGQSSRGGASFFTHHSTTTQEEKIDQYWNLVDSIIGFDSPDQHASLHQQQQPEEIVQTSFSVTGSGFSTGSGGTTSASSTSASSSSASSSSTGSNSGGLPIYTVFFGLVVCNSTNNMIYTYFNGQDLSSTAASAVSTGQYSSGDPYYTSTGGSQMTGLPAPVFPNIDSGSATGGSSSHTSLNGCRVPAKVQKEMCIVNIRSSNPRRLNVVFLGEESSGKKTLLESLFVSTTTTPATSNLTFGDTFITVPFTNKYIDDFSLSVKCLTNKFDGERFPRSHYRCNLLFIVYDTTNLDAFNRLPHWIAQCTNYPLAPFTQIIVVGTKQDLIQERAVSTLETERYIQSLKQLHPKTEYFETSINDPRRDKFEQITLEYFTNLYHILLKSQQDLIMFIEPSYINLDYYTRNNNIVNSNNNNNNNNNNCNNNNNGMNPNLLIGILKSKYLASMIFKHVSEIHSMLGLMTTHISLNINNIDFLIDNRYFNLVNLLVSNNKQQQQQQLEGFGQFGNIGLIKLLQSGFNNLDILNLIIPKQTKESKLLNIHDATRLIDESCAGGNVEVVQFLHSEKGYQWSIYGLKLAVMLGHLSVLEYIFENTLKNYELLEYERQVAHKGSGGRVSIDTDAALKPFYLTKPLVNQSLELAKLYHRKKVISFLTSYQFIPPKDPSIDIQLSQSTSIKDKLIGLFKSNK